MIGDKIVTVEFPEDFLRTVLIDAFRDKFGNSSELVANTIISQLQTTPSGMSQVLQSLYGYEHKINYLPGDEIWAMHNKLYYWDMNIPEMTNRGMIVKDCVKAKVLEIDKNRKENVKVRYTILKKNPNFGVTVSAPSGDIVDKIEWIEDPLKETWINDQYLKIDIDCKLKSPRNLSELL